MKFHPTNDQKLALVGLAWTAIFGFLPSAFPTMDRGYADLGMATGILAILFVLRHDAISIWHSLPGVPRYLPLHEAARRYHEAMRNTVVGKAAFELTNSPDDVLNWYGFWFVRYGVPIFGMRPPSRVIEQIPPEKLLSGGSFLEGAKSFHRDRDPGGSYSNLMVLKKDLRNLWPQLLAADLSCGGAPDDGGTAW